MSGWVITILVDGWVGCLSQSWWMDEQVVYHCVRWCVMRSNCVTALARIDSIICSIICWLFFVCQMPASTRAGTTNSEPTICIRIKCQICWANVWICILSSVATPYWIIMIANFVHHWLFEHVILYIYIYLYTFIWMCLRLYSHPYHHKDNLLENTTCNLEHKVCRMQNGAVTSTLDAPC